MIMRLFPSQPSATFSASFSLGPGGSCRRLGCGCVISSTDDSRSSNPFAGLPWRRALGPWLAPWQAQCLHQISHNWHWGCSCCCRLFLHICSEWCLGSSHWILRHATPRLIATNFCSQYQPQPILRPMIRLELRPGTLLSRISLVVV